MMKIQWWRVALVPVRLVVLLGQMIACTFGRHGWVAVERPMTLESGRRMLDCYEVCARCQLIRLETWHAKPYRESEA